MSRTSGCQVLGEMLQGGLSENRNVLLVGGSGTGQATLGMQCLHAGIERGESSPFARNSVVADTPRLVGSIAPPHVRVYRPSDPSIDTSPVVRTSHERDYKHLDRR